MLSKLLLSVISSIYYRIDRTIIRLFWNDIFIFTLFAIFSAILLKSFLISLLSFIIIIIIHLTSYIIIYSLNIRWLMTLSIDIGYSKNSIRYSLRFAF